MEKEIKRDPIHLNSAWYDPDEQNGALTPQKGVAYLWVIREDGHLILGVEDGSSNAGAFTADLSQLPAENIETEGLGHPTLAARFDPDSGVATPSSGRIGGELFYQGMWIINDYSASSTEKAAK